MLVIARQSRDALAQLVEGHASEDGIGRLRQCAHGPDATTAARAGLCVA